METQTESTAHEVRCERCDCSFAPGTKRCVHCGDRLGGRLRIPGGAVHDGDWDGGEETQIGSPTFIRAALWLITVAVALAMSLFRVCSE